MSAAGAGGSSTTSAGATNGGASGAVASAGSTTTGGFAESGGGGVAGSTVNGGATSGGDSNSGGSAGAAAGAAGMDLGEGPMGTGGGTFVQCDDHADFNGRGRCAPTGNVGAVFAFENLTAGAALTTLTASFGSTKPPSEAGCTEEAVGSCRVLTCAPTAVAAAGTAAGAITAKSSGGSMTTTPDQQGRYDLVKFASPLWSPMAAVSISAAGGAMPAFGESFCGPPGVTFSAPATAPSAALVVSRSSDLALAWSGSNVGDLELRVTDESNAASRVQLSCSFTAASGQGSVPKAALAKISAGAHTLASYTWVRKIGAGAGGACTELTAIMTNYGAGAVPFNGAATFQ